MKDGLEAGRSRKRVEKKPADSKGRVQFHLGETLIERLGVHCSLAHKNQSAMVEEILTAYLTRFGRGRELFRGAEELGAPESDRRKSEGGASPSCQEESTVAA